MGLKENASGVPCGFESDRGIRTVGGVPEPSSKDDGIGCAISCALTFPANANKIYAQFGATPLPR
jgi:hypothetical protein